MQRQITSDQTSSQDDALATYKEFLTYAGEEVNMDTRNHSTVRGLFLLFKPNDPSFKTEFEEPEMTVHSHTDKPCRLSTVASRSLYCSKLIIRNMQKADLSFNFANDIIHRIVGMHPMNRESGERLMVTYRNIVPSRFLDHPELAGPMGYHEYIIDGSNYRKVSELRFIANSDSNLTPLRIIFENCQGKCAIKGLDEKAVAQLFTNKSTELQLEPVYASNKPSFT